MSGVAASPRVPLVLFLLLSAHASASPQWAATQEATLLASAPAEFDLVGRSVAVDGNLALVGAHLDDEAATDAGAAYLFERDASGAWSEVAKLTASDASMGDAFGYSVALAGDRAVVGALVDLHPTAGGVGQGSAYVFERDQGGPEAWGEVAKLVASDAGDKDRFGNSVAVSGDVVVVGADAADGYVGAAYVFERDQGGAGAWGEVAKLPGTGLSTSFGVSVAVSGSTALVGSRGDDEVGINAGAAHVFERDQGGLGAWGEVAKLTASDGSTGSGESFGISVALEGDTAVVGAFRNSEVGLLAGAAYVFERDHGGPGEWGEVVKLLPEDLWWYDAFGTSVAISGDLIVVGSAADAHAPFVPGGALGEGSAYLFERDRGGPEAWGEGAKIVAGAPEVGDLFGTSVAISGAAVLVGAPWEGSPGTAQSGAAHAYSVSFEPEVYCTSGVSGIGCRAFLSASGQASATAPTGFVLSATNVEGSQSGLFFFGTNGRQAQPWGNGTSLQCVAPPVTRAGLLSSSGTKGICDGTFSQDLNALWCATCPKPQKNPGAGSRVQAQLWYRDPWSTSNQATGFSDAIEFVVGP